MGTELLSPGTAFQTERGIVRILVVTEDKVFFEQELRSGKIQGRLPPSAFREMVASGQLMADENRGGFTQRLGRWWARQTVSREVLWGVVVYVVVAPFFWWRGFEWWWWWPLRIGGDILRDVLSDCNPIGPGAGG